MSYQPHPTPPAFLADLARLARDLHTIPELNDRDRAFLQDVARGRFPMVAIQRLLTIARQSERPELREAPAEIIRAWTLRGAEPATCIASAFDQETAANGDANVAQRFFERAPCPSTAARVRDALTRQLATTRAALDAVLTHRVWQ